MRSAFLFFALGWVTLAACSSDSDAPMGTGCSDSMDCPEISCVCVDGAKGNGAMCSMHVCSLPTSFCDQLYCHDHGGTQSATETPRETVVGTPECDAFCGRIAALQCPSGPLKCDEKFWCSVRTGECPAAARAHLQCEADKGTFKCEEQGWSSSSGCSTYTELCAHGDGGTSDAPTE